MQILNMDATPPASECRYRVQCGTQPVLLLQGLHNRGTSDSAMLCPVFMTMAQSAAMRATHCQVLCPGPFAGHPHRLVAPGVRFIILDLFARRHGILEIGAEQNSGGGGPLLL